MKLRSRCQIRHEQDLYAEAEFGFFGRSCVYTCTHTTTAREFASLALGFYQTTRYAACEPGWLIVPNLAKTPLSLS